MLEKNYLKTRPVCKVTFTLPLEAAPEAHHVQLLADFNDWGRRHPGVEMKKTKHGYRTTVELEPGRRYEFRYLIDHARWENDWHADGYVPSPFAGIDNSVLILESVEGPSKARPASPSKKGDDLRKIEGIGPKIASLFEKAGLGTFDALAAAPVEQLQGVLDQAGSRYRAHDPSTWPQQAAMARDGRWEELRQWQEKLKGGRRK
jgi:hypothetical protein